MEEKIFYTPHDIIRVKETNGKYFISQERYEKLVKRYPDKRIVLECNSELFVISDKNEIIPITHLTNGKTVITKILKAYYKG